MPPKKPTKPIYKTCKPHRPLEARRRRCFRNCGCHLQKQKRKDRLRQWFNIDVKDKPKIKEEK